MPFYTSYFDGPHARHRNAVAICRRPPKDWEGHTYKRLAPVGALLDKYNEGRVSWPVFAEIFNWYLSALNIREELTAIRALTGAGPDDDVYLLCHEPPGENCHRRLFARAAEKAGVLIKEAPA